MQGQPQILFCSLTQNIHINGKLYCPLLYNLQGFIYISHRIENYTNFVIESGKRDRKIFKKMCDKKKAKKCIYTIPANGTGRFQSNTA